MSIERIVRPFQVGDPFTARVLAPNQPAIPQAEEARLSWKGDAEAKWNEAPGPGWMDTTVSHRWVEITDRRQTEKVRVENPDDHDQFVIVERIKAMTFINTGTGEQFPLVVFGHGVSGLGTGGQEPGGGPQGHGPGGQGGP